MAVSCVYKWKAAPSLEAQVWCENVVSDGKMKSKGPTRLVLCVLVLCNCVQYIHDYFFFLLKCCCSSKECAAERFVTGRYMASFQR